jgi:hypothetical protein
VLPLPDALTDESGTVGAVVVGAAAAVAADVVPVAASVVVETVLETVVVGSTAGSVVEGAAEIAVVSLMMASLRSGFFLAGGFAPSR